MRGTPRFREARNTFTAAATAAALTGALSSAASADFVIDLTPDGQTGGDEINIGAELRPADGGALVAPLSITSRYSIDPDAPRDGLAAGSVGTIYVDDLGLGVQTHDGGGSKGISGGGGDQDEELIFTFLAPALVDSLHLGLADFKPGDGLGHDDDPLFFLRMLDGTQILLDEIAYLSAYVPASGGGDRGTVDFGAIDHPALDAGAEITSLVVRETRGHLYVDSLVFQSIPAPGALALFALAAIQRRRRRA